MSSRLRRRAASASSERFDRLLDAVGIVPAFDSNSRRTSPKLVDIDMAPQLRVARGSIWIPLLMTSILAALLLVALRDEVTDMSYELAEAGALERELLEQKRALTVEMRRLRDPARLVEQAEILGFRRPERVIDLRSSSTPEVAAGPANAGARP